MVNVRHMRSVIGAVVAIVVLVALLAVPGGVYAQESVEVTPTVVVIDESSLEALADAVAVRLSAETLNVSGSVTVTDMPAVSLDASLTISPDTTITVDPWHIPGLSDEWPLAFLGIVVIGVGVGIGAYLHA